MLPNSKLTFAKELPCFEPSCCFDINLLKPGISTSISFSLAMSWVKSIGKPKVSCSLNATSPEITFSPEDKFSSRIFNPFPKVSKNLSSSV